MAFWWMVFKRFLMMDFGIFNLVSFSMECSCMAPLTPAVMVMMRLVLSKPSFWMVLFSESYLACFCVMACSGSIMIVCEFNELYFVVR